MKYSVMAAILLGSFSVVAAASAADLIVEPEAAMPIASDIFDWSGLQLGVQGVYFSGTAEWQNITIDDRSGTGDVAGGAFGITGSVDQAFGQVVLGLGAQYNIADIDGHGVFTDGSDFFDVNVSGFGSVDGRVGIAMGRVMPYLTAGVAFAQVSHTYYGTDDFGSDLFVGWDIGAGAQMAVTDSVIGNVAVRYADYGSKSYGTVGGLAAADHDLSLSAVLVSAGLSFKF